MRLKVLITLFFSCSLLFSQTGPAGVGSSANNVLWLKADAGTSSITNSTSISYWNDQSGNSINVTQTVAVQQPSFTTNVMNGMPAILFDNNTTNTNDKLYAPDSPILDNTSGLSIFTVSRLNFANQEARTIISKRNNVGNQESYMLFYYDNSYKVQLDIEHSTDNRFSSTTSYTTNTNYIINAVYDGTLTAANRSKIYFGETMDKMATEASTIILNNNSPLNIGTTHDADNRPFGGYIAEVIVYTVTVTDAQRIIINNYLSSKYDIALTSNDKYSGDTPANGNYDFEVSGIGNESTGSSATFSASVSGGIGINNVSGLDAGDYIFAGHTSATNNVIKTDVGGMTGGFNARWSRVWYLDITNTSTALTNNIEFDNSDGNITGLPLGAASNYVLLYRAGLTGNWTELTTASAISGDKVRFTNIVLSTDGYYTIGTKNYNSSPLPIELLNFDAIMNNKHVDINWATATEINNDFFTVEKSKDAINFETVSISKGAGNSNTLKEYADVDYDPYQGISYYRLKQTDFNGTFKYSKIVAVNYNFGESGISVFPNPTDGPINISFKGLENQEILVVIRDITGKECFSKVILTEENNQIIAIDPEEKLAKGNYIIIASSSNKLYSQKIIVK
jgi:hypothetical protein